MKALERKKARELRKKGYSFKEIVKKLGVAKSSVSLWVRDIELSEIQKRKLSSNQHSRLVVEKRRASRLKNENARREKIKDKAKKKLTSLGKKELFILGIGLYWAEGAKKNRNVIQFSNSDPNMIIVMMHFFRAIMEIPEDKFRGHICLHPHLDEQKARKYWSKVAGIPLSQFYKTTQQHNIASKNKKDSLPYGTINMHVCDTEQFLSLMGWIEKLTDLVIINTKK